MLGERAHELERQAARADDDRGAELDRRHARPAQDAPDLLPAAQVRGQVARVVAECSEVDHAPDSGSRRGGGEVPGAGSLLLLETGRVPHGVNQVVRDVDPGERPGEARAIGHVALHDLHTRRHALRQREAIPREASHELATAHERREQAPADVARGAREEDTTTDRCRLG